MRQPKPSEPKHLTASQAASLREFSPKTVSRWAKEGKLPFVRTLGGHRRYPDSEIRALVDSLAERPGGGSAESTARAPPPPPPRPRPVPCPGPAGPPGCVSSVCCAIVVEVPDRVLRTPSCCGFEEAPCVSPSSLPPGTASRPAATGASSGWSRCWPTG